MAAVTICSDFGAPQNKVCPVSTVSPSISHEVGCHDLSFLNVECCVFDIVSSKCQWDIQRETLCRQ